MSNPVTTRAGSKGKAGNRSPDEERRTDAVEEVFDKTDPNLVAVPSPQPVAVSEERFEKSMSEISYAIKGLVDEIHKSRLESESQTKDLNDKFNYVLNANNELSEEMELKFAKIKTPDANTANTPAFKNLWDADEAEDSEPVTTPAPVPPKAVPNTARRGSIFAFNLAADGDDEKLSSQSPIVFARTSTVLKEAERQQTLSVKAYLFNKERYDELKSQNPEDKAFTLATTISQPVIRKLINNERMHNTAMSQLTGFGPNAFYSYPDDVVIDMFALYFKPISPKNFGELFYSALKDYVLKSDVKGWVFGHKKYHNALFANLNELLFKMEEVYNLLTKMQKKGDENLYPKLGWGKKGLAGMWRYFTYLFGDYEEQLIHALPDHEETLKNNVKTEAEFFALYRKLNDSLAKQSREQEVANERLIVTGTLQEQFPQYSFNGESKVPAVRGWNKEDAHQSLKLVSAEVETEHVNTQQHEVENEAILEDDPAELYFGRSNYPNRPVANNSNTSSIYPKLYKDKPAERVLPCYSWAQNKKCPTGAACVWSHDDKVCREYAEKQVSMLAESPYLNAKVREAIVAAYPSAVSVGAKEKQPSVSFRTPIPRSVNGRMLIMESDINGVNDDERVLSEAKDVPNH